MLNPQPLSPLPPGMLPTPRPLRRSAPQLLLVLLICLVSGTQAARKPWETTLPSETVEGLRAQTKEMNEDQKLEFLRSQHPSKELETLSTLRSKGKSMPWAERQDFVLSSLPDKWQAKLLKHMKESKKRRNKMSKVEQIAHEINLRVKAEDLEAEELRAQDPNHPSLTQTTRHLLSMAQQYHGEDGKMEQRNEEDDVIRKWWSEWMVRGQAQRSGQKQYVIPSGVTASVCEQFEREIIPRMLDGNYARECNLEQALDIEGKMNDEYITLPAAVLLGQSTGLCGLLAYLCDPDYYRTTLGIGLVGDETVDGLVSDFCSTRGPKVGNYCGREGFYANVTVPASKYAGSIATECNWTLIANSSNLSTPAELMESILSSTQDLCVNNTDEFCLNTEYGAITPMIELFLIEEATLDQTLDSFESFIPKYCSPCGKLLKTARNGRKPPRRAVYSTIPGQDCEAPCFDWKANGYDTDEYHYNENWWWTDGWADHAFLPDRCANMWANCGDKPCCGDGWSTCYTDGLGGASCRWRGYCPSWWESRGGCEILHEAENRGCPREYHSECCMSQWEGGMPGSACDVTPCCGRHLKCYQQQTDGYMQCLLEGECNFWLGNPGACEIVPTKVVNEQQVEEDWSGEHEGCGGSHKHDSDYCPDEDDKCWKKNDFSARVCKRRDNRCILQNSNQAKCKPVDWTEPGVCKSHKSNWNCDVVDESERQRILKEQQYADIYKGITCSAPACLTPTSSATQEEELVEEAEAEEEEDSLDTICARIGKQWCYLDQVRLEADPTNFTGNAKLWCESGCLRYLEQLSLKRTTNAIGSDAEIGEDEETDVRQAFLDTYCRMNPQYSPPKTCYEVMQVYNRSRTPLWDEVAEHCNAPLYGSGTEAFPSEGSNTCNAACNTAWQNWMDTWGCCARTWSSAQEIRLHRWMLYQGQACGRYLPDGCFEQTTRQINACFYASQIEYSASLSNIEGSAEDFCEDLEDDHGFDFHTCEYVSHNPYLVGWIYSGSGLLTGQFDETTRLCLRFNTTSEAQTNRLISDLEDYTDPAGVQLLSKQRKEGPQPKRKLLQSVDEDGNEIQREEIGGETLLMPSLSSEPAFLRSVPGEVVTVSVASVVLEPLPPIPRKEMPRWGDMRFKNISACNETRTWKDLKPFFRNHTARTGGLGSIEERGQAEAWICVQTHLCVLQQPQFSMLAKDKQMEDFMCYVYNEVTGRFVPWGFNSQLKLVKY